MEVTFQSKRRTRNNVGHGNRREKKNRVKDTGGRGLLFRVSRDSLTEVTFDT